MSTQIQIASSSALTIGTTPISSGTNGRVLFQAGGVLQQDAGFLWDTTNKRMQLLGTGVIATPASNSVLEIKAKNAFSDIVFRIRNSVDTRDLFNVRGNRTIEFLADTPSTNGGLSITGSAYNAPILNCYNNFGTNLLRIDSENALIAVAGSGNIQIGGFTNVGYLGMVTPTINNRFLKLVDNFANEYLSIGGNSYDGNGGISMTLKTTTTNNSNFIIFSRSNNTNPFVITDQAYTGIGNNSPQARLDVRAQGALSTDIAFRVRNSADSADIFSLRGNGEMYIPLAPYNGSRNIFLAETTVSLIKYSGTGNGCVALGHSASFSDATFSNTIIGVSSITGAGVGGGIVLGASSQVNAPNGILIGNSTRVSGSNTIKIGNDGGYATYGGTNTIHLGKTLTNNTPIDPDNVFVTYFDSQVCSTVVRSNGSLGLLGQQSYIATNGTGANGLTTFMGNGGNTLVVKNHPNIPSLNITDAFQMYSNDIVAGNAAPHFRTELGDIIKLYKETTAVAASTLVSNLGVPLTDTDTFDGYTLKQVVKTLKNLGILA